MIGTGPIFVALDGATIGHRITGDGIYKLVQRKAKKAGTDSLKIPQLCKSYQFLALGVAESVYDGLRNGYLSELEVVK